MPTSKRHLISAALAVSVLSVMPIAHAQTALQNIEKTKLIKIAIPTDFPPYGFVGTDLKPQGLDIDMANYIGSKMGPRRPIWSSRPWAKTQSVRKRSISPQPIRPSSRRSSVRSH
jgi:ABC-type amino acid transport substrate-binding protein